MISKGTMERIEIYEYIKKRGPELAMKDIILSLIVGALLGAIFRWLKLPSPAPAVLSGIIGIFGIYLGSLGMDYLIKHFTK
jgi:XapX domain-containing protein